jgi:hypothetical protein
MEQNDTDKLFAMEAKIKELKQKITSSKSNMTYLNMFFLFEEQEKYVAALKEQFVIDDKMELIALLQKTNANLERIAREKTLKAIELQKQLQQGGGGPKDKNLVELVETLREANDRLGKELKKKIKEEDALWVEMYNKEKDLEERFLDKERNWKLEVAVLKNQIQVWKIPDTIITLTKKRIEDYEQELQKVVNKLNQPQTLEPEERKELMNVKRRLTNNIKTNKEKYNEMVQNEEVKKELLKDEGNVNRDFLKELQKGSGGKEEEEEEEESSEMMPSNKSKRNRDMKACVLCANPAFFKAEVFYCSPNCKNEHCTK